MLINKFGLTANDPYHFTVYEREVPLTANLAQAFDDGPDGKTACAVPEAHLKEAEQRG
jgi:hypothetical protein